MARRTKGLADFTNGNFLEYVKKYSEAQVGYLKLPNSSLPQSGIKNIQNIPLSNCFSLEKRALEIIVDRFVHELNITVIERRSRRVMVRRNLNLIGLMG